MTGEAGKRSRNARRRKAAYILIAAKSGDTTPSEPFEPYEPSEPGPPSGPF